MNKVNKFWAALALVVMVSNSKKAEASEIGQTSNKQSSGFRVVGYLRDSNVADGTGLNIDFDKITYLNIAFINPDEYGNFITMTGLSAVINAAHSKNVKVLASIGGGSAPAYYSMLLSDVNRADFIHKIVRLAEDDDFDGVDVDLEGDKIDKNYEPFIIALSAAMKQQPKVLTAAIATVYKSQYTDEALAKFDFINIMSYDKTGPWNPANPGQHAPYDMAVSDLDYWTNTRGLAKEKLSLGLPFYGYGFGTNAPSDMSYGDIVSQYPGSENIDQVIFNGGGILYYNGIPTIKNKMTLALEKSGGVMIWQLLLDANGRNSLLDVIHTSISAASKK